MNNEPITLQEPYESADAKAMQLDKEWFENHPEAEDYIRWFIPYECLPNPAGGFPPRFVHVVQIRPGFRMRLPLVNKLDLFERALEFNMSVRDWVEYWLFNHAQPMSPEEQEKMRSMMQAVNN